MKTIQNGIFDGAEAPITGVMLISLARDDLGNSVSLSTRPWAQRYSFTGLRPGTYVITETQPGSYLDGRTRLATRWHAHQ